MYIDWKKPNLNKQLNHVAITLISVIAITIYLATLSHTF